MKRIAPSHLPRMRVQGLVVDELPDEVLVYDLKRHKAHCLNQTAAMVWHHCDGRSSVAEIKTKLEKELGAPVDEQLVRLALDQLERDHLLADDIVPPQAMMASLSRRAMVRRLGIGAAVAVPLITSIIAPTPAQANTCIAGGQPCTASADCCSKICTGGNQCM